MLRRFKDSYMGHSSISLTYDLTSAMDVVVTPFAKTQFSFHVSTNADVVVVKCGGVQVYSLHC